MSITFDFALFKIGAFSGIGSIIILAIQFFIKRYSFFKYFDAMRELFRESFLCLALCKAASENYKFIIASKGIAVYGHTQNNAWLKPYKCFPNVYAQTAFGNDEVYCYKLDYFLLFMIKIARCLKSKTILEAELKLGQPIGKIEFFKNKAEAEDRHKEILSSNKT